MSKLEEVRVLYVAIDDLEKLSLFQRAILKDIHYYNRYKGEYKFIKDYTIEKYKEVINAGDLINEINELIENEVINVKSKKSIYNGKFVTYKKMTINYDLLELEDIID